MAGKETDWKFAEEFTQEPEPMVLARADSNELGIDAVSPATGSQLALLSAATVATNIVEIGTGAGVSGLWLLRGAPQATLTSIDIEADYQQHAKKNLLDGGVQPNRLRLITGRATEVLPRMNEETYDLVLVDADPGSVIEYVEHGLRLVRAGGIVAVAHALWRGQVSDPTYREEHVAGYRDLIREIADSTAVISSLSPIGDGLLMIARKED